MRIADLVRSYIITNSATQYKPALMWDDGKAPFDSLSDKVLLCRQEGKSVDAYVRRHDIEVLMFTKANAEASDLDTLLDDAESALEYVKANFKLNDDLMLSISRDITAPYLSTQGRYFVRFNIDTFSQ